MKIKPIAKITDILSSIDKKEKGAYSAEWQILKNNIEIDEYIMDFLPISSVHTSLSNGIDIELDLCFFNDYIDESITKYHREKLEEAFELAEFCGNYQKRRISVIVHMKDEIYPVSHNEIIKYLEQLFKKYPHCDLAIENVLLLNNLGHFRTAWKEDSVSNFVKEIKNKINPNYKDRIGSVLDICHALGSIRMKSALLNKDLDEKEELEKYFINNSDICKIIHFNNVKGFGIKKEYHGIGFNDEKDLMIYILDLYKKYIPEADFVIEVQEKDYSDAKNFENIVKEINDYNR